MSCDKSHLSLKYNWLVASCFQISSSDFFIGIHTYHRRVYLRWLTLICAILWRLIYFHWSVLTSLRILSVPVNFLIWSVQFLTICNEMILRYTFEACICFLPITFITLIIRVARIEGWFLIAFLLSLLLNSFLSWVWISILTAPWLRKIISFIFSI